MLSLKDTSDSQIDFDEIFESALLGQRFVDQVLRAIVVLCRQFGESSLGGFGSLFFFGFVSHLFDILGIDSFHHVFEFADGSSQQRSLGLIPRRDRIAEQLASFLRKFRQYRGQVDR